jgi:hypothetical protein
MTFPTDVSDAYLLPLDDVVIQIPAHGKDVIVRGTVTDMWDEERGTIGVELTPYPAGQVGSRYIKVHTWQVRRLPNYPPVKNDALQQVKQTPGIATYVTDAVYDLQIAKEIGLTYVEEELRLVVERA